MPCAHEHEYDFLIRVFAKFAAVFVFATHPCSQRMGARPKVWDTDHQITRSRAITRFSPGRSDI
jgi:hypothetical protein